MSMAFADRDFYYGDVYKDPVEPIKGLLSKEYAAERVKQIKTEKNDPNIKPELHMRVRSIPAIEPSEHGLQAS
jgi:gamma-glutamyltranspeptidase